MGHHMGVSTVSTSARSDMETQLKHAEGGEHVGVMKMGKGKSNQRSAEGGDGNMSLYFSALKTKNSKRK